MAAQYYEDSTDFYVHRAPRTKHVWLIRRGSAHGVCVAIVNDEGEALERAKAMAKAVRGLGKSSLVFFRRSDTEATSWVQCAP